MALKDITLGQYFPGHSLVHRLDPRTKILAVVIYIVALFLAKSFVTYAIMFALLALSVKVSTVPVKSLVRGMKPVVFILIFTAVLNLFYTPGEHVLFQVWILTVTLEGVQNAFFMVIRILMLIAGTFLLTYTTSPILLTDGLESLLGPLKKIKVPVHELAMMMSIALRFIPTLIEETDKIMSAQRARGADFESGNLVQRAKALIPLLVPLFISAFRRAEELAVAMECRCYHGGEGRTRLRQLKYAGKDWGVRQLHPQPQALVEGPEPVPLDGAGLKVVRPEPRVRLGDEVAVELVHNVGDLVFHGNSSFVWIERAVRIYKKSTGFRRGAGAVFSERIRILRKEAKLTQAQAARNVGLSPRGYQDLELGATPRGDTLLSIADFYGVSIDWLMGRTDRRAVNGGKREA